MFMFNKWNISRRIWGFPSPKSIFHRMNSFIIGSRVTTFIFWWVMPVLLTLDNDMWWGGNNWKWQFGWMGRDGVFFSSSRWLECSYRWLFFFQDLLRLFISFPVSHEICKWEIGMYRYHQYHIPRDGSTSWGGSWKAFLVRIRALGWREWGARVRTYVRRGFKKRKHTLSGFSEEQAPKK